MKTISKRVISVLLAVMMIISVFAVMPLTTNGENFNNGTVNGWNPSVTDGFIPVFNYTGGNKVNQIYIGGNPNGVNGFIGTIYTVEGDKQIVFPNGTEHRVTVSISQEALDNALFRAAIVCCLWRYCSFCRPVSRFAPYCALNLSITKKNRKNFPKTY